MKLSCKAFSEPFIATVKSSCTSCLQLERDASTPSPASCGAGLDSGSEHTRCFTACAAACHLGWSVQFAPSCPGLCLMGATAVVHKQSVLGILQGSQPCTFLPLFPKKHYDLLLVTAEPACKQTAHLGWAAFFKCML